MGKQNLSKHWQLTQLLVPSPCLCHSHVGYVHLVSELLHVGPFHSVRRCLQQDESIERLHDEVADLKSDRLKLQAQLTAAAKRLGEKHRLMAEVRRCWTVM